MEDKTPKVGKVSRRKKFGNIIFVMKGGEVDYRDIIYNALVPQGQTENTELNLGFFINIPKKKGRQRPNYCQCLEHFGR